MITAADIIVTIILLLIAGSIIFYLYRQKKRGVTCVGCPHAKQCAKKHSGSSSCCDGGKQN